MNGLFPFTSATAPNGYFINGLMVYTHSPEGVHVAKGYRVEFQDLRQAPAPVLNTLQEKLRVFLRALLDEQRLQVQWYVDAEFQAELDRYHEQTARTDNDWVRACRQERYHRYLSRLRQSQLRRQRLAVFVSRRLAVPDALTLSPAALEKHYAAVLAQAAEEFAQFGRNAANLLGGQAMEFQPMDDPEHYRLCARFLNPSWTERSGYDPATTFDPTLSIQENCWCSEAAGHEFGFWMDGFCHALLVLNRWPQSTYPGIIHHLTQLREANCQITLNLQPLSVQAEIRLEERVYARVEGEYRAEGKPSLRTVLEKKKQKIEALMGGFLRPFRVQFILRLWARSPETLSAQTAALKQAVNSMGGAQYFQPSLPTSTKRYFFQTWPGWVWGRYLHHQLYAEDSYLADLLPLATSFSGYLGQAEALYDEPGGGLVGIKTFSGPSPAGSPQHAVILGSTGSGKSMLLGDLLTQTAPHYGLTVIVDHGLSHEALVPLLDPEARPIILRPNGTVTINYLDSQGLPLTPEHIANASALVSMMAGRPADQNAERLRRSTIARYITQLYDDAFEEWCRAHPQERESVARLACVLQNRGPRAGEATLLDTYVELRDWSAECPEAAQALLDQITGRQVLRSLKDPKTRETVRNLAFAFFTPAEFPTHQNLQELIQLDAASGDQPAAADLALVLADWCRGSSYGQLFDGTTNLTLNSPVLYFELGQIPDSAADLKTACSFLVNNYVWQHIYTLPRSLRKRLVIEEASAFLTMPGAAEILQKAYEQARKYNTWLVSVFQQYAVLQRSPIRAAVMGNSQQFFVLKQNDAEDLILLGKDLGLSRTAMNAILAYPKPDQANFSAFTYFHRDTPHPVCGTAHHVASPEMSYVARTSGAHVEQRRQELQAGTAPIPGLHTPAATAPSTNS